MHKVNISAIVTVQTQNCTVQKALKRLMLCGVRNVQGSQDTSASQSHVHASAK
jgi:hypothetical protein